MRERYLKVTREILLYLATAGVVFVAMTSPYFGIQLARRILSNRKLLTKQIEAWRVARAIQRLQKNRVIILKEESGKFLVKLTEKGKRKVREIQLENFEIQKPPMWDGKWHVVIADIPEKIKEEKMGRARDVLRDRLLKLGFYPLQKSVWACPWPCEKEVLFLCELFGITPYVNILTTEKIYNDIKVKKHFHLL